MSLPFTESVQSVFQDGLFSFNGVNFMQQPDFPPVYSTATSIPSGPLRDVLPICSKPAAASDHDPTRTPSSTASSSASTTLLKDSVARPVREADPQGVRAVIEKVFRLFNDEFVREFLLYPDVSADLAMLTSPLPLSYAMCGTFEDASYETEGNSQGQLDRDFVLDYVTLPAFSVGNIGVGALLEEITSTSIPHFTGEVGTKSFSRFVTDATTAEMLNVCYREKVGVVDVFYLKPDCYTSCTSISFRFDRSAFVAAFRGASSGADSSTPAVDYAALTNAMLLYKNSPMERFCPLCNASPKVRCKCELKFVQPGFPLDFSHYAHNMGTYVGRYVGEGVHRAASPQSTVSGKMLSRCSITITPDNGTKQRLLQWALNRKVAALNPPAYQVVPQPAASAPSSQGLHSSDGRSVPSAQLPASEAHSQPGDSTHQGSASSHLEFESHFQSVSSSAITKPGALSPLPSASHNVSSGAQPDVLFGDGRGQATSSGMFSQSSVDLANIIGLRNAPNATPIAPRETVSQRPPSSEEDAQARCKEERRLRRIQKNRESAARSNLRRRQLRDQLKKDLQDAKARAESLRKREIALREDNMRLRSLLPRMGHS